MSDLAWVKCASCGEYVPVPWELLGDTKPEEITDYRCDACDPDPAFEPNSDGSEDYLYDDDPYNDPANMWPLELD